MLTDAQKNALRFCECGHIFISHGIRGCDLCGGCKVLPRTINTTETAIAALIASEVQQATTYLARGQRRSVSLLADAKAELATARVTNDRLNRRVQIAESALNELNGNGQGAPNKIHREAWTRHQEAQAKLGLCIKSLEATTEALVIARTKLNKIGALAEAWEHTDHDADEREPDCAGCWSASIWAILGDES